MTKKIQQDSSGAKKINKLFRKTLISKMKANREERSLYGGQIVWVNSYIEENHKWYIKGLDEKKAKRKISKAIKELAKSELIQKIGKQYGFVSSDTNTQEDIDEFMHINYAPKKDKMDVNNNDSFNPDREVNELEKILCKEKDQMSWVHKQDPKEANKQPLHKTNGRFSYSDKKNCKTPSVYKGKILHSNELRQKLKQEFPDISFRDFLWFVSKGQKEGILNGLVTNPEGTKIGYDSRTANKFIKYVQKQIKEVKRKY